MEKRETARDAIQRAEAESNEQRSQIAQVVKKDDKKHEFRVAGLSQRVNDDYAPVQVNNEPAPESESTCLVW
jgi:hypothetical protein